MVDRYNYNYIQNEKKGSVMKGSLKLINVFIVVLVLASTGYGDRKKGLYAGDVRSSSARGELKPMVGKDVAIGLGVSLDRDRLWRIIDTSLDSLFDLVSVYGADVLLDVKKKKDFEQLKLDVKGAIDEFKKDPFQELPSDMRMFMKKSDLYDAKLRWAVLSMDGLLGKKGDYQTMGLSIAVAGNFDSKKFMKAVQNESDATSRCPFVFTEKTLAGKKVWRIVSQDAEMTQKMKDANVDPCMTWFDDQLVLVAQSPDTLAKQIRLYRNGMGKGVVIRVSPADKSVAQMFITGVGDLIRQCVDDDDLKSVSKKIPNGDKLLMGLKTFFLNIRETPDRALPISVNLSTASEEDAEVLRTYAKTGLMMLRAQVAAMGEESGSATLGRGWMKIFDTVKIGGTNGKVEISIKDAKLLIGLSAIIIPSMQSAMLNTHLSSMSIQGRKLVESMILVNVERMGKLGPVWPRTVVENGARSSDDVASRPYRSATDYFNVLFDMDHYGTSKWDPIVDGDILRALGNNALVGKTLRAGGLDWCVAANITDETPDFVPVLVSANFNPALLLRKWDGLTDRDKRLPIGPSSGAVKSMFNDKGIVIILKSGAAIPIQAKFLTYDRLYHGEAFDLTNMRQPLVYLTPTGIAEPVGHK